MNSSVHMLSEVMAGSMTTADGTADVAVRLTYKPRDPHALIVTITERAGMPQGEEPGQLDLDAELERLSA
jgi:hypothetical protein